MTILKRFFFFGFLLAGTSACDETMDNPIIPNVLVNEQLNLTNIQYNALRRDNGYVYLKSGVKGIILLHKTGDTYLAFERNCPYRPFDECAQVSMDSSQAEVPASRNPKKKKRLRIVIKTFAGFASVVAGIYFLFLYTTRPKLRIVVKSIV